MSEVRGLLLAAFLSALTVVTWQFFFSTPQSKPVASLATKPVNDAPVEIAMDLNRVSVLSDKSRRLEIATNALHGSINLKGARFDDITLADYRSSIKSNSEEIVLLSPAKTQESYFAEFGWVSLDSSLKLPNSDTVWTTDKDVLSNNEEALLKWDNGQGLLFLIKIKADDKYLFYVDQYVVNNSSEAVRLIPYGRLNRSLDKNDSNAIFHEGAVKVFDDKFEELSYNKIKKHKLSQTFSNGWFGFADKYWFAAMVPFGNKPITSHIKHVNNKYQLDFTHSEMIIEPNTSLSTFSYLFAGAKEINILDDYANNLHIKSFDRVVDFGMLYFITKPIFLLLQKINSWLGNFGLAILVLTVFVRVLLLPISIKATMSMLKMRKIRPEVERVKKLNANDKVKLNKEVMVLFKKNNVSPMSGLLPSIMQIPVFFALYKVLSITIEMRHAPFYGWITDLSAKDPTNIFTLFGLLDWGPPSILCVGILPVMLGLTMVIQQNISQTYQSYEGAQSDLIRLMPYAFTFLFAGFPAGLVVYWVWNNILSILQQLVITKWKFKND